MFPHERFVVPLDDNDGLSVITNGPYIEVHTNTQLELDPNSGPLLVDRVTGGLWNPMAWTSDNEDEDDEDENEAPAMEDDAMSDITDVS